MSIAWLLAVYCLVVALASACGGWLPTLMRLTHLKTQMLMSFVAGLMLGIATLHLIPHAMESLGSTSRVGATTLAGILGMFLLLRAFHVHAHGVDGPGHDDRAAVDDRVDHHVHVTTVEAPSGSAVTEPRGISWMGMFFGLGLHTIMDGVALGASVAADAAHGAWLGLAGLGTFLAVALHKPLDAFSISTVMSKDGWTLGTRTLVNVAFSFCCPLGAGLFYFGVTRLQIGGEVLGYGLALSGGFFICIALSDLLPEVHFHDHDRGKLTAALLIGVALAVGIENLPGHSHDHHHLNHHGSGHHRHHPAHPGHHQDDHDGSAPLDRQQRLERFRSRIRGMIESDARHREQPLADPPAADTASP